ncbi:MAG: type II toxin-antitoxin system RelE/ParE family toxin [Planctomycetota bacterium]|nr:type II toxin-antitoxin system RelE/ParE family toxin [Planctomycetota bacterium]
MRSVLIIRPEAAVDIQVARDWYEGQRSGLGSQFLACLGDRLNQIQGSPQMYAQVLGRVRRCKIRRFPYLVFYREFEDRGEVLAMFHASRNPQLWQSRVCGEA